MFTTHEHPKQYVAYRNYNCTLFNKLTLNSKNPVFMLLPTTGIEIKWVASCFRLYDITIRLTLRRADATDDLVGPDITTIVMTLYTTL